MKRSDRVTRLVIFGALAAALAAVSGCRKEEQGRILYYKQGVYLGKPDQKLTAAQDQALRARTRMQKY